MKLDEARQELFEDYLALCEKYKDLMPFYEFGFGMIQFASKMLMDCAPRHKVALKTIKVATEEGIKWHVEELNKKGKKPHEP